MKNDIKDLRAYIEQMPEDAQTGETTKEIKDELYRRVISIEAQLRAVLSTLEA